MKRPPSYSDSYIFLNGGGSPTHTLAPLTSVGSIQDSPEAFQQEGVEEQHTQGRSERRIGVFVLKSSLHVFLISVFETVFFFEYVSVTENNGILKTINTYYDPLQQSCYGWGPVTKGLVRDVLDLEFNQTQIDSYSQEAFHTRQAYNSKLLNESLSVSGICFVLFSVVAAWLKWRQIAIPWKGVLVENLMMVILLGLYEYFFFRGIIYNYDTISTPELNAYILDGLWSCTAPN